MRPLYGRDDELRRLTDALGDVERGRHGRMVLLLGEPGIGKTRLAEELAHDAGARGLRVAWGRCEEEGRAPAYWAWAQLLRALLPHGLDATPELGAILPELRGRDFAEDANEARLLLFDAVGRALRAAAAAAPLVLIVDDVHAADEASLRLLRLVARDLHAIRALLVVTQRDAAARPDDTSRALLRDLGRESERISLSRLSLEEVSAWIAEEDPTASALAAPLHRVTEGNPLFVEEVLRVSRARGRAELAIPSEVRDAVDAHLALCDPEALAVLAVGAVMGRELEPSILARAAQRPEQEVRAALTRATALGVVTERGDGAFVLAHVLLRDPLERRLTDDERARAEWRVGEAFVERGERVRAVPHLVSGAAAGDLDRIVSVATGAAAEALARHAYEDATTVLASAARALPAGDPRATRLAIDAAAARIQAGDVEVGRADIVRLAASAKAARDGELVARAALAYGQELRGARTDGAMTGLARDALALLPDDCVRLRARVMARLASAMVPGTSEDHREAHRLATEARRLAEETDDDTRYAVLQWAVPAMAFSTSSSERAPLVRLWASMAERSGDALGELRARQFDLLHRIEEGDPVTALPALEAVVRRIGRPHHAWRPMLARAICAVAEGRLADAQALSREMLDRASALNAPFARLLYVFLRLAIFEADGDADAWARDEAAVMDLLHGGPPAEHFRAWAAALSGRLDEARACIAARTPIDRVTPSMLCAAGTVACRTGDQALAREVYDRMSVEEARSPFNWGPSGALCTGPTALALARLAWTLERPEDAQRWYARAIALTTRVFPAHRAIAERERARVTAPQAADPPPAIGTVVLARDGDGFRLEGRGARVRLDDRKGVHYLARLLDAPGRELHVLDLIGAAVDQSDVGPLLDGAAKSAYRARLAELTADLEEAGRFADLGREARARREIDALTEQLAQAVGLGGRDRARGASVERARINVQRRLRDVLDRIEAHAPGLGRWLSASIRTGVYCAYEPMS
jgi:hypothetical protein